MAQPNLWPNTIRAGILSPEAILRNQGTALSEQTAGLLEGRVITEECGTGKKAYTLIHFELFAPAIGYSNRILTLYHDEGLVYPAVMEAPEMPYAQVLHNLRGETAKATAVVPYPKGNRIDSDAALYKVLAEVFASPRVVAVAQSMIARASEAVGGNGVGTEQPTDAPSNSDSTPESPSPS